MRYDAFVQKVRSFALFGDDVLSTFEGTLGYWHLQLNRWAKKGQVIRLKKGIYALPEERRACSFSVTWLANALYSPSYLSLEYVMSLNDFIPEQVHRVTSITSLKTKKFQNLLGVFSYRHLKNSLFFGFEEKQDEFGKSILIATPEKALLDFIYLYPGWENTLAFLQENLRLQNLDQLKSKRFNEYALQFRSKKIFKAAQFILKEKNNL